ncbi:hypothetical protein BJY04DRAFT_214240 [Aspergillus karnatakaensis]|uniref:uncharacterized protein n=1 Tax=Aspergillus karnatakaensis TaxID=1810916 RepID=UPI003CCCE345
MTPLDPIPSGLCLSNAKLLLSNPYLPLETGIAVTDDGMHHIAVSTYMKGCTGAMIDWWFGWIHKTEQYKLWHPRDHVFSDWEGPRDNDSTYIGGHLLVHEYIGGTLAKMKVSFCDPSEYFGPSWKQDFQQMGYSTAICGRGGEWDEQTGEVAYGSHMVHLIKDEPDGVRMRSRFWVGDIPHLRPDERRAAVPDGFALGLLQHATEEMAILGSILPGLYAAHSRE